MPSLVQLIHLLDRTDITEVVLQNDRIACAKVNDRLTPITKNVLDIEAVSAVLDGTPMYEATVHDGRQEHMLSLDERHYKVSIVRSGPNLKVKIVEGEAPKEEAAPSSGSIRLPTFDSPPKPRAPTNSNASQRLERPRSSHILTRLSNLDLAAPSDYVVDIVHEARKRNASDVHIISDRATCLRCVGLLQPQGDPIAAEQVQDMLLSLMNSSQRESFDNIGYADFSLELGTAGRTRINIARHLTGLKACLRLVPAKVPTLESLSLPVELRKIEHYHQGLAIISGPNGHGKTSTMGALIDILNSQKAQHIITVENPVEIIHPAKKALVSQREVGVHTQTFYTGLKGALRQDPDVIVIGELRDLETVEIALAAAETGHLVITTMNTRTGATTIDRLISIFPPDKQAQVRLTLATTLVLIICQRLIPNKAGNGMVAAAELITSSQPFASLIREDKLLQLPNLQARGRSAGMIQFDASLKELFDANKITKQVALQFAENPGQLATTLGAAHVPTSRVEDKNKPPGLARGSFFKRRQ